jgi:hypothetical protein
MKRPVYSYDRPLVPEHLTKMTIEKLPFDEAYYISPGERDDYEPPVIFVTPDRELKMSKAYAIDIDEVLPMSPLGLVGIMRVAILDPASGKINEALIGDLRFLEDHQLVDSDDAVTSMLDQEEFMAWVAAFENSMTFDGFIAPEAGFEIDEHDIPNGTMYGDEALHPFMKKLRKRSNKIMKKFMKREARGDIATHEHTPDTSLKPNIEVSEQKTKPASELSVKFVQPSYRS